MRISISILLGLLCLNLLGNRIKKDSYEQFVLSRYCEVRASNNEVKQSSLAGTFSGIINDKLVIAGGANVINDTPGGIPEMKFWSDVYIISPENPEDQIIIKNSLPQNIAYGASATIPEGLLLIGGSNENGCQDDVFLIKLEGTENKIKIETWPSLPVPLTNMTAAQAGNLIYVAGGNESTTIIETTKHFLVLDVNNKNAGWKKLPAWPGPSRSFALSSVQRNGMGYCFYLFGGVSLNPDSAVILLDDVLEYDPGNGSWKRLHLENKVKRSFIGGAAFSSGINHIIIAGGLSNSLLDTLQFLHGKQTRISNSQIIPGNRDSLAIINNQITYHLLYPGNVSNEFLLFHTITNTIISKQVNEFDVNLTSNAIRYLNRIHLSGWENGKSENVATIITCELTSVKTGIGLWNIIILIVYFGILAWMGWYFSKRQKNTSDYFKGGGKMSWWLVALSIYGTSLSSITYMAIPAKAYATDWSYMIYNFGMITAVPVVVLLFIPFYRRLNITTAYEYLEKRFNLTVRTLASIAFIIFQIGRIAIVLFLPSIALNIITGFDIFLCIALMGIISLIYTAMGGIEAVIWTDAIQVIVLFGGAILALIFISSSLNDGLMGIISVAGVDGKFQLADTALNLKKPTLITAIIATFFANLTTYGTDQTMVQRYMTTPTKKMAVQSVWAKVLIAIPGGLLFFFIGSALYVFFKSFPEQLSFTISDGDAIFPWFIFTQMPPVLSGLLLSGILAAAMSTVSAGINSAATAYSVDLHYRFGWNKKPNNLSIPKTASVICGLTGTVIALMMATWEISSLWDQFIEILGLIMGSFGGLFLLGMLTKKANGTGALVGIVFSVIAQIWISKYQLVHGLLYVATGSITCFIVGYVSSLLIPVKKGNINGFTIETKL